MAERIDKLDSPLDFTNRVAWLLDIALKHLSNPQSVTVEALERDIPNWTEQERLTAFLAIARYVAADLIGEGAEGRLAIAFLQKLVNGKQPTRTELARLAEALDIESHRLGQIKPLSNGEKKTNGV